MRSVYISIFLLLCCKGFSQQTEYVDFLSCKAHISFGDKTKKEVLGQVTYLVKILKDTDSVFIDARNMTFHKVNLSEKGISKEEDVNVVNFNTTSEKLILYNSFKKNKVFQVELEYSVIPKKALYFIDWDYEGGNQQIWTQGQGKYISNWLPSIDDMNEKIAFDLSVTFDSEYEVIANGKLVDKQASENKTTWHYDMQQPMSSYLVALAIGKYDKKTKMSKTGVPLELYYYPEDSLRFESTYRYSKKMFDFLEDEIGIKYPWQNYKQIPVKDFLYAGMENTSATIFSDAFVVDSIAFIDKNYVNVNAHELAHQWFGDLVTEVSGTHHWLQEGFATYYALLVEKAIFGEDYYLWRLYQYANELREQDRNGGSTALLNPTSSSTTFYKKGAWVLHVLRDKVGDLVFKTSVKNYLEKHKYKNVQTSDFIKVVENVSGQDLNDFVDLWLKSEKLPYEMMQDMLKKASGDFKTFMELDCENDIDSCWDFIKSDNDSRLKAEVIKSLKGNISEDLLKEKDILLRQAIIQSIKEIPINQKKEYETFLNDESYITKEIALFKLWRSFPESQQDYLNKVKGIEGFNDKNVRMLWLALALITKNYEPENKAVYFEELTEYTSPKYGFEIRINAFRYLDQIQACEAQCKINLKEATSHHNWQFKKFARALLGAQ